MGRTLAIGDIHGCRVELDELLARVAYVPSVDRLVFVGDLVDRGPDPVGVVRLVRELQRAGDVIVIKGNHEEKLCRWFLRVEQERATRKPNKMSPPHPDRLAEWAALTADEVAWLRALPLVAAAAPGWLAVHAGLEPRPIAEQTDKVMRVRWVDNTTGKMAALKQGAFDQPEGSVCWMDRWEGPDHVVYGHTVHSLQSPRIDRRGDVECWGIDTGCCFGGKLTALCLETRELHQVQSHGKYADLKVALQDDA